MKKEYKMPEIQVVEMKMKACLLGNSNTATSTGTSVTVDEWEED